MIFYFCFEKNSCLIQKGNKHSQNIKKPFMKVLKSISRYANSKAKMIGDKMIKTYFRIFQKPQKANIKPMASASNILNPLSNMGVL